MFIYILLILPVSQLLAECPAEDTDGEFSLTWRRAAAHVLQTADCPGDTSIPPSVARRECTEDGVWSDYIDTSSCVSPAILTFTEKVRF